MLTPANFAIFVGVFKFIAIVKSQEVSHLTLYQGLFHQGKYLGA